MTFYTFKEDQFNEKDMNKQYTPKWANVYEEDKKLGDCKHCPLCGKAVSSLQLLEPRRIRFTSKKYPDLITAQKLIN